MPAVPSQDAASDLQVLERDKARLHPGSASCAKTVQPNANVSAAALEYGRLSATK